MSYKIDLSGQRFGRLVVIEYAGKDGRNHSRWRCRCDCGGETIATAYNLRANKIISCGCARREQAGRVNLTHGHSKTRLYSIFSNMVSRTENPKATAYKLYGGRGIKICAEWRHDFFAFEAWALSHGYTDNLSIDRVDNNKGYSPDNCRWVYPHDQFLNRRSNRVLEFRGITKTAKEWADEIGLPYHTLCSRLNAGWPVERALREGSQCTI